MLQKTRAIGSLFKTDFMVATLIATIIGISGLWPHSMFAHEIGELRYFHGAYDEDFLHPELALGNAQGSLGLLSGFALNVIYRICPSSLDAALIASDFVFPFLVTCTAYFAASQLISGRAAEFWSRCRRYLPMIFFHWATYPFGHQQGSTSMDSRKPLATLVRNSCPLVRNDFPDLFSGLRSHRSVWR